MKKNSIAIINYELGKLYSCHELEESNFKRRGQILSNKSKMGDRKECSLAISYFEMSREILEESIEMAETLDYLNKMDFWFT